MEEGDDKSWDHCSSFSKLNLAGYRDGILNDFEEVEAEGRLAGYHKGIEPSLNSTIFLARIDGLITACILKLTLTSEQEKEAYAILEDVKKVLVSSLKPSCDLQSGKCNCSSDEENSNRKGDKSRSNKHCELHHSILTRTKTFCAEVGWNIPDELNLE